jgi:signal transduction histidine kinase
VLPEELLPADVAAKWHEMYTRALESGPFTVDYTTASGRVLRLSFNPVTHQGKVWGISTFGRDITEFRRAEQMQSRLERELIQAQKMESLGRLAGGVAHDFNNMLDGIMGHAELMSATETDPSKRARLAAILRAATRSSELTRKLLAFARRGKNIVEGMRMADLVGDGLAMVHVGARTGHYVPGLAPEGGAGAEVFRSIGVRRRGSRPRADCRRRGDVAVAAR